MKLNNTFKLIVAIAVSELAGIIGSFFTMDAIPTWYATLARPTWNPPSWLFGPVWVTLYAMMGVAAWLVWMKMDSHHGPAMKFESLTTGKIKIGKREGRNALTIFGVQLFLNAIWSIIFFGLHSPGWAFVEIILLWLAIVATIVVFAKISKPAAWLLVPYILWVSFAGFLNFTIWDLNKNGVEQVYCTADAMQCSDGTYVGRSGVNCEFVCPEIVVDPSWKTATDTKNGISFRYPETLSTTYMRAFDWPPQVQIVDGALSCVNTGKEIERAGRTELRMVDDRAYCVTALSEGAAGSTYTQYAYAVGKGLQTWIFTATLRASQCGNYNDPQRIECEQEREAFDFDSVMDKIIRSATIL
ncbi:MAG: hypothetical protein ACD_81C00186G0011 [uncultured bacterium]|uniref:TspO and MBR like protein n=2 Tax=Candidatus Wolfeibacteriota TaxID=1752735 RepID=A0A0G1K7D0_9BACT|nr:MAG: hypothetical protein ACD_81C00186G0011 [uncultured bacterium]KKR12833.1 MAG: TspO and MBR like protein [Candidatus Wolfebacteria bacterium GW2011_GWC2_39_22]KKT43764.1 MAG: TspO and MBR like protein [Candidatus Wolfebacteria bacterium GW2011_GWE2_44_13]HBI25505.1 hypothetical protein [Candidatus Wolfebacteria bacterium]